MLKILRQPDEAVNQVAAALEKFEKSHASAECIVYRYNPAAIRIRIVDAVFQGQSKGARHDYAMQFLRQLPDDVLSQMSILLCLAPGESSMLDLDFENPDRSLS